MIARRAQILRETKDVSLRMTTQLNDAACFLPLVLSFRRRREGLERVKRDWKRKNSHPVEGLRLPHPGPVDGRDCGNCAPHRGSDCGADSIAHDEEQVLRAAFAARG